MVSARFLTLLTAGAFAALLTGSVACTERAKPSDFNPTNPVTAETAKPAEPEAKEPDSITFREMGPAPELTNISVFANSKATFLKDLTGRTVLLNFFTLGDSVNDRKLVRRYNAMYRTFAGKPFTMMGVLTASNIKTSTELLRRANLLQIAFPVALDQDGSASRDYKAASLPASYLIDESGKIIFTRAGEGGTDYLENAVRQKLGMPMIPERD